MIAWVIAFKWLWTWMITPHPLKSYKGSHHLDSSFEAIPACKMEEVAKRLYYKRRGTRVYALYTGR